MGKKSRNEKHVQGARQSAKPRKKDPGVREFILVNYRINFDAMEESPYEIPDEVDEQLFDLHELIHENPRKAIPRLKALKERYPDVPILYNYLGMAYSGAGKSKKAEEVVVENYRKNPEYLFARLNYAEICLQRGELDEIPRIFDDTYDLKMLYPEREEFHVSEVVGFMGIMALYFMKTQNYDVAGRYYGMLREIAPDHPITKRIGKRLALVSLTSLYRRSRSD